MHTITVTIPTARILAVGAGLVLGAVIGAGLAYAGAHGFHEFWMPVVMMPGYLTRRQVAAAAPAHPVEHPRPRLVVDRSAAIARAQDALAVAGVHPAVVRMPDVHPAVAAFDTVPAPVRAALDALVDHVLAEKHRCAA